MTHAASPVSPAVRTTPRVASVARRRQGDAKAGAFGLQTAVKQNDCKRQRTDQRRGVDIGEGDAANAFATGGETQKQEDKKQRRANARGDKTCSDGDQNKGGADKYQFACNGHALVSSVGSWPGWPGAGHRVSV